MKFLSKIETTASALPEDENADQYVIMIDGGRKIFSRTTAPSGAGEVNGDIWLKLP